MVVQYKHIRRVPRQNTANNQFILISKYSIVNRSLNHLRLIFVLFISDSQLRYPTEIVGWLQLCAATAPDIYPANSFATETFDASIPTIIPNQPQPQLHNATPSTDTAGPATGDSSPSRHRSPPRAALHPPARRQIRLVHGP